MEKDFFGLVYDSPQSCFREDTVEGTKGIVRLATYIAELSQSDEEPYEESIETLEDAFNVLSLYDYEVIPVTKENHDLFQKLVAENDTLNNRLSSKLEEQFYRLSVDFEREPVDVAFFKN